jgi:hypothetical protein
MTFGRHILVPMYCAMAVVCWTTEHAAAQTSDRAAAVTIEWRDRCQQPDSRVFYTVTLSAADEVQYEGLKEVRQFGTHSASIAKARAREVRAKARAIVADVKNGAPDPEVAGGECLRILMRRGGQDDSIEILSSSPAATALGTLLKQSMRIQDWICPARMHVPARDFNCGQPALRYVLTEKHACLQGHVMEIYSDGTAHYYVTQSEIPDLYGRIASAQVEALTQLPADDPALERLVVPGVTARIFYATGATAIEYSDRLQQATGFKLKPLPPSKTCDFGKEFPVGQLALPR